jgi:hypothetical protein
MIFDMRCKLSTSHIKRRISDRMITNDGVPFDPSTSSGISSSSGQAGWKMSTSIPISISILDTSYIKPNT